MGTRDDYRTLIKKLIKPLKPIATGYPIRLQSIKAKAFIFDIYGTLLMSSAGEVADNTALNNAESFTLAMLDGGWDRSEINEKIKAGPALLYKETKNAQQQRRLQGILHPEIDILQVWHQVLKTLEFDITPGRCIRRLAISYECRVNPAWPMPGLVETVSTLKNRKKRLGIISNAQFYTPVILEALLGCSMERMGFKPELAVWSYQKLEGKPSPVLFEQIKTQLSLHDIQPDETLFIGNDMQKDIQPAALLGWKTALFAGDKRSLRLHAGDKELMATDPDIIIDDLRQLLH